MTHPTTTAARFIPVSPIDLISAARGLLRHHETPDCLADDRAALLEDTLTMVSVLLRVARVAEAKSAHDASTIRHLAERLAMHGPHLLGEIEAIEEEQAALAERAEVRQ